jgi:hypothetical protein
MTATESLLSTRMRLATWARLVSGDTESNRPGGRSLTFMFDQSCQTTS